MVEERMSRMFWSFYSAFYDTIWDSAVPERIADAIASHLPEGAEVLDFGCGTGLVSRLLLARRHGVVAVDSSTAMLRRARSGDRATEFFLADIPPPDRRFVSAVAVNVLHLADSPEEVLQRCGDTGRTFACAHGGGGEASSAFR